MTGNKSYLSDYEEINGGLVAFRGDPKGGKDGKKMVPDQKYILLPLLTSDPSLSKNSEVSNTEEPRVNQEQDTNVNNTNNINTISPTFSVADIENSVVDENIVYGCINDPNMPNLEKIVYSDEEVGGEADMNNLAINMHVSPILTTRVHKDHPLEQIIRDIHLAPQTRRMKKNVTEHEKALYGLHQAPRAWYETLSTYLLENGFRRDTIDKALFIKKDKGDILLVSSTLFTTFMQA
ncbi:putative ribonuclease H-like domain-containing protein [Tanacetum coccineum]